MFVTASFWDIYYFLNKKLCVSTIKLINGGFKNNEGSIGKINILCQKTIFFCLFIPSEELKKIYDSPKMYSSELWFYSVCLHVSFLIIRLFGR